MSLLRGALKSGIALKAAQIIRREASKPENQRKIKEMVGRLRDQRRRQRPAPGGVGPRDR